MNTCVALVGAYLRFNGYVTMLEQPVLVGEGKPYRYHTATDVDILAVRFPNAAVVVPREGSEEDDLHLDVDPILNLDAYAVDVVVAEVKSGRPRLNDGLRDPNVLYATLRRVDPGFDTPLFETIEKLIRHGEARCQAAGKRWRFRLVAFGEGQAAPEGGPYMVVQLRHVASFLMQRLREHRAVWQDAQFGDPVLDLLHLLDKMGFDWQLVRQAEPQGVAATVLDLKPKAPVAARRNGSGPRKARKNALPPPADRNPAPKRSRKAN